MSSAEVAVWFKQYVDAQDTEIRRLADCAEELGKSYSYISHCFRREYGKSPEQYLLEVRLRASRVLLRETSLPIIDVILQVGVRDDVYFRKAFREQHDCTMTEYRNDHWGVKQIKTTVKDNRKMRSLLTMSGS
jgi:AraC-like DNA-binding protein